MVELCETVSFPSDGQLGLRLGKPSPCIICPGLRELDGIALEVEGERRGGHGSDIVEEINRS